MMNRLLLLSLGVAGLTAGGFVLRPSSAVAATLSPKSYADAVFSYTKGGTFGLDTFNNPEAAVGKNDWMADMVIGESGPWTEDIGVSLGFLGSLTLEFTDNYLTGSGDDEVDLWIFEIGKIPEAVFVEISADGDTWYEAGIADKTDFTIDTGVGIDIDGLLASEPGLSSKSLFSFVRLTDTGTNTYNDDGIGKTGADIDAIAAASSVDIPEPGMAAALGAVGLGAWLRRKRGNTVSA